MSEFLIQGALEKRLAMLDPQLATAYENTPFTPVDGEPYQRVFFIPNRPVDHGIAFEMKEWRGLFQISLLYPLDKGRKDAQQRADALAAHFAPFQTLAATGLEVQLHQSVDIASGFIDDNRWHVPVTVFWRAKSAA